MSLLGIYIPTFRRGPEGQRTWKMLPPEWRERTRFCIREDEAGLAWPGRTLVLPGVRNISTTRQAIMDLADTPYVLMLDDDLEFYRRPWQYAADEPENKRYLLRGPSEEDMNALFATLEQWLCSGFVHVAVSMREGNNRCLEPYTEVGRGIRAVAYDVAAVKAAGCRFREEVDTKEDFDMTLQLLRRGFPNRISYEWAQGQPSSNTPGGCETYRDEELMRRVSENLARLHSGYVKVAERENKNWDGIGSRWDVTVYWQKAYDSAKFGSPTQESLL